MNRRELVRRGVLTMFAAALGKLDIMHAESGLLTCDLSQWRTIRFSYKGEVVDVTVAEVFRALKEGIK